jgi:hypothetical protein
MAPIAKYLGSSPLTKKVAGLVVKGRHDSKAKNACLAGIGGAGQLT